MARSRPDTTLALLLLLPSALLLGPWQVLFQTAFDPLPTAGAAGAALLAGVPAAIHLVRLGRAPRLPDLVLLLGVLIGIGGALHAGVSDSFGRDQALCVLALFALGFLGGASLREQGPRVLAGGLMVLGAIALLPALLAHVGWAPAPFDQLGLGGAPGNTGYLSHAYLPGAAVGLGFVLWHGDKRRLFGALLFAAALAHAHVAPVLTALVALGVAVGLSILRRLELRLGPHPRQRFGRFFHTRLRSGPPRLDGWLGAAALWLLVALPHGFVPSLGGNGEPAHADRVSEAPFGGDRAGLAVRGHIWLASLAALRANPWHGWGPGQFAAQFPPHRPAAEIELSSLGRALEHETEVEHPHSDWVVSLVEFGFFPGLAWIGLLLLGVVAAVRAALRAEDAARFGLGLALAALMTATLAHGPLLHDPLAAPIGGVLFGLFLGRQERRAARPARAPLTWLLLIALLALVPSAWSLARHGMHFGARSSALAAGDGARAERALAAALAARPDSPAALGLSARQALYGGDLERAAQWNDTLLRHRPHRIEALVQAGLIAIAGGRPEEAREPWERVQALDPAHPANANLFRLHLEHLDPNEAATAARKLQWTLPSVEPLLPALADAQLSGWLAPRLLAEVLEELDLLDPLAPAAAPNTLLHRANLIRSSDAAADPGLERLAAAFESLAHALWAEEHLIAGDVPSARRSMRQAWRASREPANSPGSPLIALELAALELDLPEDSSAAEIAAARERAQRALQQSPPTERARSQARAQAGG